EGLPTPGTSVRLVDESGRGVPDGDVGEIALIGPQQFVGYSDPALNAQHFIDGGWFLSGDMARRDPETGGYVITDRKKDIIIRGGENISAKEVEDAVAALPEVFEVAAVAQPDSRYGEKVCVYVVPRSGAKVTLEAIHAHFTATGIAKQKTPERLILADELPRTPTGKVK